MKKYIFTGLFFLFLCLFNAYAQERDFRQVNLFTKLAFGIPGKLYLKQGSPQSVEIEAKHDVLGKIKTRVEDGKLIIEKEKEWGFNWGDKEEEIVIYVTVEHINGISVNGSGDLIAQTKIVSEDMELKVSGSGEMFLTGECKSLDSKVSGSGNMRLSVIVSGKAALDISGSGNIKVSGIAKDVSVSIGGSGKISASELKSNTCLVRISGSGDAEVNTKEDLEAKISGSGSIAYKGDPSVHSKILGSGSVRKL